MRVLEAARRGRIKLTPDSKGGMMVEGRRRDVAAIAAAVTKRDRKAAKRLLVHVSDKRWDPPKLASEACSRPK